MWQGFKQVCTGEGNRNIDRNQDTKFEGLGSNVLFLFGQFCWKVAENIYIFEKELDTKAMKG